MRLPILLALLLGLASFGTANADPLPFERGSWAKLSAAHAGQPTRTPTRISSVSIKSRT